MTLTLLEARRMLASPTHCSDPEWRACAAALAAEVERLGELLADERQKRLEGESGERTA